MKIKHKKILYILIAVVILGMIGSGAVLARLIQINNNYGLERWKENIKTNISDGTFTFYHVNNDKRYIVSDEEFTSCDVKQITRKRNGMEEFINCPRGYKIDLPAGMEYDFTSANEFIRAENEDYSIVLSKEHSPYTEIKPYVEEYLHKFLQDERFKRQNNIEVHQDKTDVINDLEMQVVFATRTPAKESEIKKNTYAYCYIYDEEQRYYRVMIKGKEYNQEFIDLTYKMLESFDLSVKIEGKMLNYPDYESVEDPDWNKETRKFYRELVNSDELKWGIYIPQGVRDLHFEKVEKMENKIDYTFDGMIEYIYFWEDFPAKGMQAAYEKGKIVELTVQCSTIMNEDLNGWSPAFDIIDGVYDDEIRKFAKAAKEFSHPFLFRLNNEMNSDWTSYCSSILMCDPQLYIELWHRIYDIFKEEGVDNAIWIFNPNDNTFPPCGFNDPKAYYPGNGYAHVFGVTGYNTGTYYFDYFGETWKEFEELYDEAVTLFDKDFGGFPWVITEFASSSVGGDKVEWINNMFDVLHKYDNIKMAFWFNSADYDPRYPKEKIVSRPYWLDETDETLEAFGKRVSKSDEKTE